MNASRYTWRHYGDARPCPDTVPATGNPLVAQRTTYPNTQILPRPARLAGNLPAPRISFRSALRVGALFFLVARCRWCCGTSRCRVVAIETARCLLRRAAQAPGGGDLL